MTFTTESTNSIDLNQSVLEIKALDMMIYQSQFKPKLVMNASMLS